MRTEGIEPSTSVLSGLRSTTELCALIYSIGRIVSDNGVAVGVMINSVLVENGIVEVAIDAGEVPGLNIGNFPFIDSNPSTLKDCTFESPDRTLKLRSICSTKNAKLEITKYPKIMIIITAIKIKIKF